jgi:hypothetical protein
MLGPISHVLERFANQKRPIEPTETILAWTNRRQLSRWISRGCIETLVLTAASSGVSLSWLASVLTMPIIGLVTQSTWTPGWTQRLEESNNQ